jgi:hypothetical protein
MAVSPAPNPETVVALLDTTWRVADEESGRTDGLDRKATSIATFASVVVSLSATLGTRFLTELDEAWALGVYVVGVGLLVGAVVAAARVLLPREHLILGIGYLQRFPMWSEVLKPAEQVRGETMKGLVEAIAREREINRRKALHVRHALVLLLAGLAVIVLEALILGVDEIW